MANRTAASDWLAKRREARRSKRERTGDSSEKRAERKRPSGRSTKDAMARVGEIGFLSGG